MTTGDVRTKHDVGEHSRRRVLLGALVALGSTGGMMALWTGRARADVASDGFNVAGDSVTTDNGQLTSLEVSISDGHVSYDGLDTVADSVDVDLFASPSGGAINADDNRIASQTFMVAVETGLKEYAGHVDYSFSNVDALAATDLKASDFSATGDGETEDTDIDIRIQAVVRDANGNTIIEDDAVKTVTISVTNQSKSANSSGSGATDASGTNQQP